MKQIHFFYFFRATLEGWIPIIVQIIVEHDDYLFNGAAAARQLACDDNGSIPHDEMRPLCVVDVPEIRLLLNRGDVQAVYGRVSPIHPTVTVYDLDSVCQNEEEAAEQIRATMDASGFQMIPFAMGNCGNPQPK